MGIGVRYDDGSGSMKPLASYKGMASPWGTSTHSLNGGNFAQRRVGKAASFGFGGQPPRRKTLMEEIKERRNAKKIRLDDIDPRAAGSVIGSKTQRHPLEADDTRRKASGHDAWERAFMSGIHFEREATTGRIIVWEFNRTDKFTGEGRCFETTGEDRVPVFSFFEGGDASNGLPRCYDIASIQTNGEPATSVTITFSNAYFTVGGKLYSGPDTTSFEPAAVDTETFVALKVPADATELDGNDVEIETYESIEELNSAMADTSFYLLPLYHLTGTSADCDFRSVPSASMGEY